MNRSAAAAPSGSLRVLALPLAFTLLLASFGALPLVRGNPRLLWSFWGAAGLLLAWNAALFVAAARRGRKLEARFVLRTPHWLQACVHLTIYAYWGWYWRQVYGSAPLILGQLVFAYAFDMLLAWSRQDSYELGFGPFPVIFSTNLFLWFKADWFYLQFLMIATGFAGKQLLRWQRDGRPGHIFNPSSFPLALASVILLLTGTTDHTWLPEVSYNLSVPPHIYLLLAAVSLPGQLLFGVASMTLPAVTTAFILSAIYHGATGSYYFFGPIPAAAFLGMLLLFTDPATSPRTELGRIIYGALYGLSVFALYGTLELLGQPTSYDKLLFVPFLNLGVRAIDRFAQLPALQRFNPARWLRELTGRPRNAGWTGAWAAGFLCVFSFHGLGDVHPANRLPFWRQACAEGLRNGCRNLETMESKFCARGSGWACNELGARVFESATPPDEARLALGSRSLERACVLGFQAGCANAQKASSAARPLRHLPPQPADYDTVLDWKSATGQTTTTTLQLWQTACEQGWTEGCESVEAVARFAGGPGPVRPPRSLQEYETACAAGDKTGCRSLGLMYRRGDGVARDDRRALACELGIVEGCIVPR